MHFKGLLYETYKLKDDIVYRLDLSYLTKIVNNGNTKDVRVKDGDGNSNLSSELLLDDITEKVWNKIVDDTEEDDAFCDSQYMLLAMDCFGKVIFKSFYWIDILKKCYLVMDNTGVARQMMILKPIQRHMMISLKFK